MGGLAPDPPTVTRGFGDLGVGRVLPGAPRWFPSGQSPASSMILTRLGSMERLAHPMDEDRGTPGDPREDPNSPIGETVSAAEAAG